MAGLEDALANECCNGCGLPKRSWGPVCGGMLQGDWTHFHSPEWWIARDRHLHADPLNHALSRRRADSNRCPSSEHGLNVRNPGRP